MRIASSYKWEISEITALMADLWLFLSEDERQSFAESMQVVTYRKHEPIYEVGNRPEYLMCLISGKVKIYRDGVGGRSQLLRLMRPVQYFGYRASMAGECYLTSAAAFEDSVVCLIPMKIVDFALQKNNALCRFFITNLAQALGSSDLRTVSLTQKHIRGRLAESLLFLRDTYGVAEDSHAIAIKIPREDLASLSNMTTSNAIRTLSEFAVEGLIVVDGRKITILDEQKLKLVSEIG